MPYTCSSSMHCYAKLSQLMTAQLRPALPSLQGASTHTPVHAIVVSKGGGEGRCISRANQLGCTDVQGDSCSTAADVGDV